jgi:dTDP-4-dehydrorhamnose reductase
MPQSSALSLMKVLRHDLPLLWKCDRSLKTEQPIEVFTDMYLAPISLEKFVLRVDELAQRREAGIFHLSGEEDVTYYSFAISYFGNLPSKESLMRGASIRYGCPVELKVPRFTSLR